MSCPHDFRDYPSGFRACSLCKTYEKPCEKTKEDKKTPTRFAYTEFKQQTESAPNWKQHGDAHRNLFPNRKRLKGPKPMTI